MKQSLIFILFAIVSINSFGQGSTQIPAGTYPACGTGPGYYRPQPRTLSAGFPPRIINNPGTYYAPTGQNQQNWNQYYPNTNTYGPTEPNPFNANGRQSIPRTINHLYHTRVLPRVNGYR